LITNRVAISCEVVEAVLPLKGSAIEGKSFLDLLTGALVANTRSSLNAGDEKFLNRCP
jgi:hypothetical protein